MNVPVFWRQAANELSAADPVMAKIIASYESGGDVLKRRGESFHTLARAIVGQQISVKAADSVWLRLETVLEGRVTTEAVLSTIEERLRACGLSGSKVRYLKALAEAFAVGTVSPQGWAEKDDEAIIRELVAVPGIGRWTAEMCLIFHLGRPDVLPLADLGLVKAVERHYFDGEKVPRDRLLAVTEAWRPWRSVATWYMWRSLDPVPVEY